MCEYDEEASTKLFVRGQRGIAVSRVAKGPEVVVKTTAPRVQRIGTTDSVPVSRLTARDGSNG